MDRRPIWLVPMVYRMWASHRAGAWAAWRLQWPGETPFEGADSLAWETSLHQEAALARGDSFAMVALDWKKAYDGITLEIIGQTLQAAGVPAWAAGPLLDMYANNRRLRVGRVIGPEWKPTSGIPAGCPIAVFAVAVCTKPWASLVGSQENITRRLYVDDSTAWASGPVDVVVETIAKAVSNTRIFEAAFGWQLHPQKSVVGCTNPKGRKRLAAASGLPAATRIKDLGAIHEVGGGYAATQQPLGPKPQ